MKILLLFLALFLSPLAHAQSKIELNESNHLVLRGEVNEISAAKLIHQISTSKSNEVLLFIDSPGGSVLAGLRIINIIENSGKKVTCIASHAASMAFAILQSCQKRYVLEDTIIMQHVMSYSLNGREPNNFQLANLLHKINVFMDKKQAKRIGLSYEEFRDKVRDDWWLFGDDAVKNNAADAVVKVNCTDSLSEKLTKEVVQLQFTTVTLEWSGCPLNSAPVNVTQVKLSPLVSDLQAAEELKEFLASR